MNDFLTSRHLPTTPSDIERTGYTLLTGATGLVGQYLVKELLLRHTPLAVLVRADRRMTAVERMEVILQRWERRLGQALPRPQVIAGDVSQPGLGISGAQLQWLKQHVGSVIHNAAMVSFEATARDEEPWLTNYNGTRHTVELFHDLGAQEFHYISTAYVCGTRRGVVKESELDCGQGFRNAYEESKFLAEQWVRTHCPTAATSIYRPSIIAGDSETGFTSSYHGLLWYLRFLDIVVPQQPRDNAGRYITDIVMPMRGDEPQNVVTVDFVAEAIARLFTNPAALGHTFHLAADTPATFRQVIDWCCEYFHTSGVVFDPTADPSQNSPFAQAFFEQSRVYLEYNTCETVFDVTQFRRFCPDLSSPRLDAAMVRRFLEFGRADKWGKRRESKPVIPANVVEQISKELNRVQLSEFAELPQTLRIEVLGPGGGTWTATRELQGYELSPGCRDWSLPSLTWELDEISPSPVPFPNTVFQPRD